MTQRHEDSDEDSYVQVGSAFEALETPEDVQRARERKAKEQYVTDWKGRRRFHGAFTGGFSAGYFNTVGTKEGWAPSSFVSSRDKKTDHAQQKPEDFMDDEDLGAHGIAPREVAAKEEFSQARSGSKRPHPPSSQPTVIPGMPPLQDLVVPARSTIGARLLKAMGWREGEGVGPKVMRYPPKPPPGAKVYGCALHGSEGSGEPQMLYPQQAEGFLFAPRDVAPLQFEGKEDMHGIGYSGMEEMGVLHSQKTTRALYGMMGEAFGIGALEEEDDEDVYGVESMTSYDVTLAGEGDLSMERKYGWTGGLDSDSWGLSSFARASKPLSRLKKYPPPVVPRDFVPVHKFVASSSKEKDGKENQKPLTSAERTQLLADRSGSVFNLLGVEEREKLRRATEMAKQRTQGPPQPTPEGHRPAPPPPVASTQSERQPQPQIPSVPGRFSLEKLKPFAHDPAKQTRYEAYLTGRQNSSGLGSSGMTEWEWQREREEFSRAARVHRPLTNSLASRFTRGSEEEGKGGGRGDKPEPPESDALQAARASMFGVLTREVLEWHPHRVLCKRFNIPDPYPGSGLVGVATSDQRPRSDSQRTLNFMQTETLTSEAQGGSASGAEGSGPGQQHRFESETTTTQQEQDLPLAALQQETVERMGTEAGEGEGEAEDAGEEENQEDSRPPMDLFKAIFAESSSASEVSSDSEPETETKQTEPTTLNFPSKDTTQATRSIVTDTSSAKQWQDLSVITRRLPTGLESETKVTLSGNQIFSQNHHTERNRPELEESDERRIGREKEMEPEVSKVDSYGPALPPGIHKTDMSTGSLQEMIQAQVTDISTDLGSHEKGYSSSDGEGSSDGGHSKHTSRRHSKHKHRHHKKTHKKEGHRHKEYRKPKHKHSKHS